MIDSAHLRQVADQCKAVAHMATAIAQVYSDKARLFTEHPAAVSDLCHQTGERTARLLEELGDILNGMDAVTDEDEWVNPIMLEAQRVWPSQ